MELLNTIKGRIERGEINEAIHWLNQVLELFPDKDEAYYLLGNAYRKMSNWQEALNNYQKAIDLNPESPAKDAKEMVLDILGFFNKDMYNH